MSLAPLIDVVFQLIAFFVFSMGFAPFNASINPPESVLATESCQTQSILVEIDRAGICWVDGHLVDGTQMSERLVQVRQKNLPIILRGDRQTPYEVVRQCLQLVREAGFQDVRLQIRGVTQ